MKNVIPYNLFEMSKYRIEDYFPDFLEIERLIRTGEYRKYSDFPDKWQVYIEYYITTVSGFIKDYEEEDWKHYNSVMLFQIKVAGQEFHIRFDQEYLIISGKTRKKIPLVVVKDKRTFFKRVKKEVEEDV